MFFGYFVIYLVFFKLASIKILSLLLLVGHVKVCKSGKGISSVSMNLLLMGHCDHGQKKHDKHFICFYMLYNDHQKDQIMLFQTRICALHSFIQGVTCGGDAKVWRCFSGLWPGL